ncbi:hypothetical protein MSG28_004488 [Choristoneura fumiferana]|uniref:Uncharacterized protein n=1 Tax=Choristoneura fumiferana TaxID=7141 RepID=A0ACC0K6B1_CHOFU|nr:hypothetical protein MSG28_004488 [Choristoneura fumiferana]
MVVAIRVDLAQSDLEEDLHEAVSSGILNDMDTFFEALRGNLEGMASLTPDERATFYDPPNVVRPPALENIVRKPATNLRSNSMVHVKFPIRAGPVWEVWPKPS